MPVIVALLLVAIVLVALYMRRAPPVTGAMDVRTLRQLSWQELDVLIADYFVREGFVLRAHGGKAADFVMEKGEQHYLVQCRHWRARRVGEPEVRAVFGHMAATRAVAAYVISGGRFTAGAVRFASGKRIELIDGAGLARMVDEVRQDPSEITRSRLDALRDAEQTHPRRVILCPRCGRPMSRRRERGEARGGSREFYGCSLYPTCKGRREIA